MQYQIVFQPSYALLIVGLDAGERVRAEAGAMVSMAASITAAQASASSATLALMELTATEPGSEVTLAPALPGDTAAIALAGARDLFVQSGSFMASSDAIEVDTRFGAGTQFFSGAGLTLVRLHGAGTAFVSSYGALREVELAGGQSYLVDSGHMVAFESGMGCELVGGSANWKVTHPGGKGVVVKLTGPGRLWLQTRSPGGLKEWLRVGA